MTKVSNIMVAAGSKDKPSFTMKHPCRMILLAAMLVLAVGAGLVYVVRTRQAATAVAETNPQTATVRQNLKPGYKPAVFYSFV